MTTQPLTIISYPEERRVELSGELDLYGFESARQALEKALAQCRGDATIDAGGLTRLDSAGALLLRRILAKESRVRLINLGERQAALYELVANSDIGEPPPLSDAPITGRVLLERLGKGALDARDLAAELIAFLGQACVELLRVLPRPKHLRLSSITRHVEETGIDAIPIIALIALIISVILAYQGLSQLRPLGAQQYTVNLIAISVLREMGVLLTAIMVAGRSGSAFASEIGVMKLREEVDALRTLGFAPFEILVLPRLLGLLVALPLLTFLADVMGLLGGGVIAVTQMGLTLADYLERVRHAAHGWDLAVGLLKAPVFGLVIGLVGSMHGFKVSGSAESVGRETTAAVVQSIFLVLLIDGVFSVFFQKVGV